MKAIQFWLAAMLILTPINFAIAANHKEVHPRIGSNQTWDFGKGNGNRASFYKWSLRSIANPALKLACLPRCLNFEGALRVPNGYKICRATLWYRSTGIPIPSTFNGTLWDQTRQLNWYADFGSNEPQPLYSIVSFDLVPENSSDPSCMHDGYVWQCGAGAGNKQGCNEFQQGGVLR